MLQCPVGLRPVTAGVSAAAAGIGLTLMGTRPGTALQNLGAALGLRQSASGRRRRTGDAGGRGTRRPKPITGVLWLKTINADNHITSLECSLVVEPPDNALLGSPSRRPDSRNRWSLPRLSQILCVRAGSESKLAPSEPIHL